MEDRDTKGDLYEYFLSKLSGTNGQFRTPRQIIRMMVELMKPTPQDKIVDHDAGTAGFLFTAAEYLREHHEDMSCDSELREHCNNTMFYDYDLTAQCSGSVR